MGQYPAHQTRLSGNNPPKYSGYEGEGSPEGIVPGQEGQQYWDRLNDVLYLKTTANGRNGWSPQTSSAQASANSALANIVALSVDTVSDLAVLVPSTGKRVLLKGFTAPGDGGGGELYYDAASTATVNNGTVFATVTGTGRWIRIWSGLVDIRWFGAKGDGTTDNTATIQAAINYAETFRGTVVVPEYIYEADFLSLRHASLVGMGNSKTSGGIIGSVLRQKAGATGHLINLLWGYGNERISHIHLQGRREQNLRNPRAITGVSSRTVFTVAIGHLPAAPASVSDFPYFGFCFFYSSENRYLGHGVISAINYGTGQVTLATGFDNYATKSSASGLLTTTEKVCFSPPMTYTSIYQTHTNVANGVEAGWSAIRFLDGQNKKIHDVYISNFHTAIDRGQSLAVEMENVWVNNCSFAGLVTTPISYHADDSGKRVFLQGFYAKDPTLSAESTSITDVQYRQMAFGVLGFGQRNTFLDLSIDQCVTNVLDFSGNDIHIDMLLLDKAVKDPFLSIAGTTLPGLFRIDSLMIATPISLPTNINYFTGYRAAVTLAGGNARQLSIGAMAVVRFQGTSPAGSDYAAVFNIATAGTNPDNEAHVDYVGRLTGATNWFRPSSRPPKPTGWSSFTSKSVVYDGWYWPGLGQLGWASGGETMFSTDGDHFRVGDANKTIIYGSGFHGLNSTGTYFTFGADQATGDARTDATNKDARFLCFNYLNASPEFSFLNPICSATLNDLLIGGGNDATKEAANRIRTFIAAAKGTLLGTEIERRTSAGMRIEPAGVSADCPDSLALQVVSTTKGFAPPSMTKAQRDAIVGPVPCIIYQTDNTPGYRFYENGAWVKPTVTADP